jgi:hypothetical protein
VQEHSAGIVYRTAGTLQKQYAGPQDSRNTLQEQYAGVQEHSAGMVYRTAGTVCRNAGTLQE